MISHLLVPVAIQMAAPTQSSDRYTRNFLPVGRPAPEFDLPGLTGRGVTLRARDAVKGTVIVFWSLGGSPNLPTLILANSLSEKHRGDLRVVAINHADNKEQVQQFWSSNQLKLPCGMNQPPEKDTIKAYGVAGYPSVYVLNPSYQVSAAFYNPEPAQILGALSSLGIN